MPADNKLFCKNVTVIYMIIKLKNRNTMKKLALNCLLIAGAIFSTALTSSDKASKTQNTPAKIVGGTYSFGSDDNAPFGSLMVYPLDEHSALFFLSLCRGAPSYNTGELNGKMTIKGNAVIYDYSDEYSNCKLKFEFSPDSVKITTDEKRNECGFGFGVDADNTYKLTNKAIPEYYINMQGDTVRFKNTTAKPEAAKADASRKSLEDAIIKTIKAFQNKDKSALNKLILKDSGIALMDMPGMYWRTTTYKKIPFDDEELMRKFTPFGDKDFVTDYKVRFEALPEFECDGESWNKPVGRIYSDTTKAGGERGRKSYKIMAIGKDL